MKGDKGKKEEKTIFESIRKPTAPASRKLKDRSEGKRDVVQRKAKHKKRIASTDTDANI